MVAQIPHIISWSHALLAEVLKPGDRAVDLTLGHGRDTLFLWQCVGPAGRVWALDVQVLALWSSRRLLQQQQVPCRFGSPPDKGVGLLLADHAGLGGLLKESVKAVVANLGYLPRGTAAETTAMPRTLAALRHALAALQQGGRLLVVVYVGHPAATAEVAAIETWSQALNAKYWYVLKIQVPNRRQSPYLLLIQRR